MGQFRTDDGKTQVRAQGQTSLRSRFGPNLGPDVEPALERYKTSCCGGFCFLCWQPISGGTASCSPFCVLQCSPDLQNPAQAQRGSPNSSCCSCGHVSYASSRKKTRHRRRKVPWAGSGVGDTGTITSVAKTRKQPSMQQPTQGRAGRGEGWAGVHGGSVLKEVSLKLVAGG